MYRSFQFGVQHHVLNAPSVLKGRFDGCVGIEGWLTVNHLRRRVSRRRTDDRWKPLNAPHRVQSKAGTDSIIHPAHFFRGEVSEEFQHPALVYGKDLLCLNDGWYGEKLVYQQAVGRLGIFFCRLACQCGHDQRGRVKISHIVLKNDCRTIPALL